MKNFFDGLFGFVFDFFPVIVVVVMTVAFVWGMVGYFGPEKQHEFWQNRAEFCKAAGGYYTNEDFGELAVCRSLHDHSVFYVDTSNGARYNIAPR